MLTEVNGEILSGLNLRHNKKGFDKIKKPLDKFMENNYLLLKNRTDSCETYTANLGCIGIILSDLYTSCVQYCFVNRHKLTLLLLT